MRFDQPFCSFGKFWWSKIMPETRKDWLQKVGSMHIAKQCHLQCSMKKRCLY